MRDSHPGDPAKGHFATRRPQFQLVSRLSLSGDFFKGLPEGADLHLLKQILHILDDERATRLLQLCHRALSADGKLLVVEEVIPSDIGRAQHWP